MRFKVAYLLLGGLFLILGACQKEPNLFPDGQGIVLQLTDGGMAFNTKATEQPGITALKENALGSSINVYFFRSNADNQVLRDKAINVRLDNTGRATINTSESKIKAIFGSKDNGRTCFIFVIANYNGPIEAEVGTTTLGQIKAQSISRRDWNETPPELSFVMTGEATLTIAWNDQIAAQNDNVLMKRIASKITFEVTITDKVIDAGGNEWFPQTDGGTMRANMLYAMKDAIIGATPLVLPGDKNDLSLKTYDTYRSMYKKGEETITRTRKNPDYDPDDPDSEEYISVEAPLYYIPITIGNTTCASPFYTYPAEIQPGSYTEPYIKLIIPWRHGTSTKEYYYKIPFKHMELLRNTWYNVRVDIQILGGENEETAPTLELTYAIADWSGQPAESAENPDPTTLPGEIIAARYLSITHTEFILYNEETLEIPIESTHDVEIVGFDVKASGTAYIDKTSGGVKNPAVYIGEDPNVYNPFTTTLLNGPADMSESWVGDVKIVHPDYSQTTTAPSAETINTDQARSTMFPQVTRKVIKFYHKLRTDMNAGPGGYDVAPYTVRFRVRHHDDPTGYYSDIIIEQRPSILIQPQRNSDNGTVDANGLTENNGYAFVNGTRTDANTSGRNNRNFNMYIIETSVLPSTGSLADYVLGDPRVTTGTSVNGSTTARPVSYDYTTTGEQRGLTNYRASNEDHIYDDYIAPKFRIASSFGASSAMNRTNAVNRCAEYQEDGYPAGRWRLPTAAEIVYMARLTTDKLIPRLLGSDTAGGTTDYWCNSSYVRITDGANSITPPVYYPDYGNNDTKYVRCVYDEWFWEKSQYPRIKSGSYENFRWGD